MPASRRDYLRLAGAAALTGLTGCAMTEQATAPPTVTPAPVPTDPPTPPLTARRVPEPPDPSALTFTVEILEGFTAASTARLEISIENRSDSLLTALDGNPYVFPFSDDDHIGVDWSGEPEVLLVPEESRVRLAPDDAEPAPIHTFLPEEPTDGCWSVPFEWPADRAPQDPLLHAVPLPPSEPRRHRYELYYLDDCSSGTFRFENTFDLAVADPPIERGPYRGRLTFDVARSDSTGLLTRVDEPWIQRIGSAESPSSRNERSE